MQEIIAEQKEEEETVAAVLGDCDETNCSYDSGYVKRQALYACKTCQAESKSSTGETILHGICLACSYECHADHELEELYTKRNFRCDCGNSRFTNNNPCKLRANKEATNPLNKYNHNFLGLYCVCNQPYPVGDGDADQSTDAKPQQQSQSQPTDSTSNTTETANPDANNDEMIQCIICEDWYHLGHLKGVDTASPNTDPNQDEYEDMVCHTCMLKSTDFLWYYQGRLLNQP